MAEEDLGLLVLKRPLGAGGGVQGGSAVPLSSHQFTFCPRLGFFSFSESHAGETEAVSDLERVPPPRRPPPPGPRSFATSPEEHRKDVRERALQPFTGRKYDQGAKNKSQGTDDV